MANKHAFITGGTGFLGLNLVEQLCLAGWNVTAMHRASSDTSRLARLGARLVEADLFDVDSLAAVMPAGTDAVFHVAGNTAIWQRHAAQQTRDNVEGTEKLLAASQRTGARRFVYTSTWATYGLEHASINEHSVQTGNRAKDNYSRSKYAAEQLVRSAGDRLEVVIINPAHILGRYDTSNWARMITLVDRGELPGIPPGAGSFCHAEEVAKAHIAAAERGRSGANYLLGGTDASFLEVITTIGELLAKPVPRKAVAPMVFKLVARVEVLKASVSGKEPKITPESAAMVLEHPKIVSARAEDELAYRHVPLRTMLTDAVSWLRGEGLVGPRCASWCA